MPAVSVYKPIAHGGGPLVVLMSSDTPDYRQIALTDASGQVIDVGRYSGRTNGNRPTYRFSRRGHQYRTDVAIQAGGQFYPIGPSGSRRENVGAAPLQATRQPASQAARQPATQPASSGIGVGEIAAAAATALEPGDIQKGIDAVHRIAPRFAQRFTSRLPSVSQAAGNPGFKGPGAFATGGGGAIGAINAAAPVAIAGIAAHTLYKGLTGKSAEERFPSMFQDYMRGNPQSIQKQPIPKQPFNQAKTNFTSTIPSANNLFQNAAAQAKRAGQTNVPDVGNLMAPRQTVDNQIFSKGGKQYVMLAGDNPLRSQAGGPGGVDGRMAVSLNRYANLKNANDNRLRTIADAERGGK